MRGPSRRVTASLRRRRCMVRGHRSHGISRNTHFLGVGRVFDTDRGRPMRLMGPHEHLARWPIALAPVAMTCALPAGPDNEIRASVSGDKAARDARPTFVVRRQPRMSPPTRESPWSVRTRGFGVKGLLAYPAWPFVPAPASAAAGVPVEGVTTTEPATVCGLTSRLVMGQTFSDAATRRSMRSWLSGEAICTS